MLLDRKANIEAKNNEGNAALDMARERGHTEIIQLLEEAAADLAQKRELALQRDLPGSLHCLSTCAYAETNHGSGKRRAARN